MPGLSPQLNRIAIRTAADGNAVFRLAQPPDASKSCQTERFGVGMGGRFELLVACPTLVLVACQACPDYVACSVFGGNQDSLIAAQCCVGTFR